MYFNLLDDKLCKYKSARITLRASTAKRSQRERGPVLLTQASLRRGSSARANRLARAFVDVYKLVWNGNAVPTWKGRLHWGLDYIVEGVVSFFDYFWHNFFWLNYRLLTVLIISHHPFLDKKKPGCRDTFFSFFFIF